MVAADLDKIIRRILEAPSGVVYGCSPKNASRLQAHKRKPVVCKICSPEKRAKLNAIEALSHGGNICCPRRALASPKAAAEYVQSQKHNNEEKTEKHRTEGKCGGCRASNRLVICSQHLL